MYMYTYTTGLWPIRRLGVGHHPHMVIDATLFIVTSQEHPSVATKPCVSASAWQPAAFQKVSSKRNAEVTFCHNSRGTTIQAPSTARPSSCSAPDPLAYRTTAKCQVRPRAGMIFRKATSGHRTRSTSLRSARPPTLAMAMMPSSGVCG